MSRVWTERRLRYATLGCFLVLAVAVLACTSSGGPRPGLEVDVARYIARLKQWAKVERDVSAAVAEIFHSHFLDAALITSVTERTLPTVEQHVHTIASYTPSTPEVEQIHARYAHAWNRLREGMVLIDQGIRLDDAIRLAQGRRRLEVWQEQLLDVAAALQDLAKDVGLSDTESAETVPFRERSRTTDQAGNTVPYRRALRYAAAAASTPSSLHGPRSPIMHLTDPPPLRRNSDTSTRTGSTPRSRT